MLRMLADEVALVGGAGEGLRRADRDQLGRRDGLADQVRGLGVSHPLLDEGLDELLRVLERHGVAAVRAASPWSPT